MIPERQGLIVWIHHYRSARSLERYGIVHYVSRKLNYVVIYVNKDKVEETITKLNKMNFVKKIELSHRADIKKEYSSRIPKASSSYIQ